LNDPESNTRLNIYTNMSTIPENLVKIGLTVSEICLLKAIVKKEETRMWANAQRDGRPAEYRWRPLFNAAKFG